MRKGRRFLAGICALALTFSFTPVGGYLPGDAGIEGVKAEQIQKTTKANTSSAENELVLGVEKQITIAPEEEVNLYFTPEETAVYQFDDTSYYGQSGDMEISVQALDGSPLTLYNHFGEDWIFEYLFPILGVLQKGVTYNLKIAGKYLDDTISDVVTVEMLFEPIAAGEEKKKTELQYEEYYSFIPDESGKYCFYVQFEDTWDSDKGRVWMKVSDETGEIVESGYSLSEEGLQELKCSLQAGTVYVLSLQQQDSFDESNLQGHIIGLKKLPKYEYTTLEDGTAEITAYNGMEQEVEIPATLGGKKVTRIGDSAFARCDGLKKVIIPESIRTIGSDAFRYCTALTSVIISEGVTDIEDYAFYGCSGLTSITIPDGVTSIGESAFNSCSQLSSISIPESVISIGSSAFNGTLWLSDQFASDKFLIVNGILCDTDDEKMLGKIQVPADVKVIGDGTFSWCPELTEVVIPEGVIEIGDAFRFCENLQKVSLPKTLKVIKGGFSGSDKLEEVYIPASVTKIGEGTFYCCRNLKKVTVSEQNRYYRSINGNLYNKAGTELIRYALGNTETTFRVPDGVTKIAFESICGESIVSGPAKPYFSEIILPESVCEIRNVFMISGRLIPLVVKGIEGSYAEEFVNGWKGYSGNEDPITFQPITWDTPKLSKVESVNEGIKLSWEKVYGAAQYRVFYQQDGKWVKLADTAETDYIWENAESGTNYTFTVRCLRKDGKTYTSDYDAAGITYVGEETPEPPNETVTENDTFGDAVTKEELHDMISLYLSAIHMADCELEMSGAKPGASRQKADAHFFQTAPSPEDAFAYCCYSGISVGYELTKAEDGTDVYVIPYQKAIAFAKKLFANLPSMKEMIDMPVLLGKYDAKQDSFIRPYGGGGGPIWVSEITGYQAVSGNIYEIYCKISKTIEGEDPNLDMNDESQHIKCKFTAKKTGKNWKLISFEGIDKFPESYGKVPKAAEDSDTGIILTANEDVIPAGSRLEVQSVKEGASFDLVAKALETSRFEIFDIKLLDGNTQIQPNGMVQVTIPLPEGYDPERTVVYHIDDQGVKTKLDSLAEDGFVVFETDHFSLYVLAEENEPSEPGSTSGGSAGNQPAATPAPGTGDRNSGFFWLLLLAAGAAACICCRTRKRSCHSIK